MSAYKEFTDIQFANAALLVQALQEMGYKPEVGQSLHLYGYKGDRRPDTAQIVVHRQQIGHYSNDLGFAWNGQAFTPIISEYDAANRLNQHWRDNLQATYSKLAVLKFLKDKNAKVHFVQPGEQGIAIQATVEV